MRSYRGVSIERVEHSGYYSARVLISGGPWGEYYRPVMADTVAGIRELIREILDGAK